MMRSAKGAMEAISDVQINFDKKTNNLDKDQVECNANRPWTSLS